MPISRVSLQLGESWVVEGEDESLEDETKREDPDYLEPKETPQTETTPRRTRRTKSPTAQSPEPELVMPSLYSNNLDGPWSHPSARTLRHSNPLRSAPEPRVTRRHAIKREVENGSSPESNSTPRGSSDPEEKISGPKRHGEKWTTVEAMPRKESDGVLIPEILSDHLSGIFFWSLDVVGRAFQVLKMPISYILAMWLLFGLGIIARNLIMTSIYSSLSPICRIPGTSLLSLPFCPAGNTEPPPPVEFDQLMGMQSQFEEVLEETAKNVGLPLELKRSESSLRDLRQLVRYSNIHSKNELELEFDGFIDTAKVTSYDLQKFNSHVGRAVDSVIATTHWTNRILDSIQIQDISRGSISAFVNDRLLAPFQPVRYTETILLDQYIKHTQIVEEEISKLVDEAQALLMVLNNLEDRLDIIHGIVTRDRMHAKAKRDEILAELWTLVGGNRGKLSKMNKQLNLLHEIGKYRKSAYAHVSGTIVKLQSIGAGLEDLRERVGSPAVLRDRIDVPLSVHMENIQRGVERLDEARQSARKVENEHIRRTLEGGSAARSLIEQ